MTFVVVLGALARCLAMQGLRLTVKARGNPDPEHTRRKLQGMPWAEAIRAALPVVQLRARARQGRFLMTPTQRRDATRQKALACFLRAAEQLTNRVDDESVAEALIYGAHGLLLLHKLDEAAIISRAMEALQAAQNERVL